MKKATLSEGSCPGWGQLKQVHKFQFTKFLSAFTIGTFVFLFGALSMQTASAQCSHHSQCNDNNPCTIDKCFHGNCRYSNAVALDFEFDDQLCPGQATHIENDSRGIDSAATYYLDLGSDGTIDFSIPASALPEDSTVTLPLTADINFTVMVVNPNGCSDTLDASISVINCDDGDPCTVDICVGDDDDDDGDDDDDDNDRHNPCRHIPMNCDDGNPCTTDSCGGGVCFNIPLCDDGNPCTLDTCFRRFHHYNHGHGGYFEIVCQHFGGPQLDFEYRSTLCIGDSVHIENQSQGVDSAATYYLDIGSDDTIDFSIPASALPTDSTVLLPLTGDVDFTVIVVNPDGCSDTLVASIRFLDCDDGDPCTVDFCGPFGCRHVLMDCKDNNPCTVDSCGGGVCFNTPICDDGDPCTRDTCYVRFVHDNDDDDDDDDDDGNHHGGGMHNNFQLVCENINICDDGDPCTVDVCDGSGGCTNDPMNCDDGDACTVDVCDDGVCQHNGPQLAFEYNSPVCVGEEVYIENQSQGIDPAATYYLDIGSDGTIDGSIAASDLPADSSLVLPFTSDVDFTVIVVNPDGCSDTLNASVSFITCDDNDQCTNDTCIAGECVHTPVINVDLGGNQTVYLGYLPAHCVTLTPVVSGGSAPYTYLWSTSDTAGSITACPTHSSTYCVTVTDANGCVSHDCVRVCVQKVECSGRGANVMVCHEVSPGRFKSLCVKVADVPAHLAHGDLLGHCKQKPCRDDDNDDDDDDGHHGSSKFSGEELMSEVEENVTFSVYPNPFNDRLNFEFILAEDSKVTLEIFNLAGQKIATLFEGKVSASELRKMEYIPVEGSGNILIYKLQTNQEAYYGKAVMVK